MASNQPIVIVTITEYTTAHPLSKSAMSGVFTTLKYSSDITIASETPSIRPVPSKSVYRSSVTTSASSRSTKSGLFSKPLTSTMSVSTTGISASNSPAPHETEVGRHPSNILPILMMLWLILIALFFLGALLYLAWRFARGHCSDCASRDVEIMRLKKRLADKEQITSAMVHHREALNYEMGKGEEISVTSRDLEMAMTFSLVKLGEERAVQVRKSGAKVASPSDSEQSDPFDLEHAIPIGLKRNPGYPGHVANDSPSGSKFHRTSSELRNRALTLENLTGPNPETRGKYEEEPVIPFWKRNLARVGLKRLQRSEDMAQKVGVASVAQEYQSMKRSYTDAGRAPVPSVMLRPENLRTYSQPGPAPEPPLPVHQRFETTLHSAVMNPYKLNLQHAHFDYGDFGISEHGKDDAISSQYSRSQTADKEELITIGLNDQLEREQGRVGAARPTPAMQRKHRSGGYGGMAPVMPGGVNGEGQVPCVCEGGEPNATGTYSADQ